MKQQGMRLAVILASAIACQVYAHGPNEPQEPKAPIPDESGSTEKAPTYYGEVKPILDAYCGTCHQAAGSAPFSLQDYKTVKAMARPILRAVENKTMPPWGIDALEKHPMKYDLTLSPERIGLIRAWVQGGAQEGNPEKEGQPIPLEISSIKQVDLVMSMAKVYSTIAGEQDEYRCFPIEYDANEDFYVTGFKVEPGNSSIVHHTALYAFDPSYAGLVDTMDASDPDYGYTCFGAPTTPAYAQTPFRTIGTSGTQALDVVFPQNTGIRIKPGTRFVIQMHYSRVSAGGSAGSSDQSKVMLQTQKQVAQPLEFIYFMNPEWLQPNIMMIPAGQKEVVHSFSGSLLDNLSSMSSKGELQLTKGIKIHGIIPHQHLLGKGMKIWKVSADGSEDLILDGVGYFTFGHQWIYQYQTAVDLLPQDKLKISCVWDNTKENQLTSNGQKLEPMDTDWGDGPRDEMCVAAILATDLP